MKKTRNHLKPKRGLRWLPLAVILPLIAVSSVNATRGESDRLLRDMQRHERRLSSVEYLFFIEENGIEGVVVFADKNKVQLESYAIGQPDNLEGLLAIANEALQSGERSESRSLRRVELRGVSWEESDPPFYYAYVLQGFPFQSAQVRLTRLLVMQGALITVMSAFVFWNNRRLEKKTRGASAKACAEARQEDD